MIENILNIVLTIIVSYLLGSISFSLVLSKLIHKDDIRKYFCPDLAYAPVIAGVACILGHIFPFYLHFDGGKGFASYMGLLLGLDVFAFVIFGIGVIVITLVTDYIVLATMTVVI